MREHTAEAKRFYNSKKWKMCRLAYINQVDVMGMCETEACESAGYIVDHIEEINIDNVNDVNITLNFDNLQFLCLSCHNKKTFGNGHGITVDGMAFDAEGNIMEV